jgi:hypothetical protein
MARARALRISGDVGRGVAPLPAQLLRHRDAVVSLLHHDVEDDQVRVLVFDGLHAVGTVGRRQHLVLRLLQEQPGGERDVRVVVHDEDLGYAWFLSQVAFCMPRRIFSAGKTSPQAIGGYAAPTWGRLAGL